MRFLLPLALALSACTTVAVPEPAHAAAEDHRPYEASADAAADIAAATARAQARGARVLLVFGANWCHDSRGLAEHFDRPELATLMDRFEVVYVDVAERDRNQDLAARYGLVDAEAGEQIGTPNLVALGADGERLNSVEDARSWRRAHSRPVSEVRDWLERYAPS